jgi:uncharacterized protein
MPRAHRVGSTMAEGSILLLCAAVFAGAVVSGLVGFAFSAVAGVVALHVLPPAEAIPFMMISSLVVQALCGVFKPYRIEWLSCRWMLAGGLLGFPLALLALQHASPWMFRIGFGLFLLLYSGFILLRPASLRIRPGGRIEEFFVGAAGALIGSLTAMPGAIPAVWCDAQGMPKAAQRALLQPFITVTQSLALVIWIMTTDISKKLMLDVALCVPAIVAGTAIGLILFGKINEIRFRQTVLLILFVSGVGLLA